ncbi:hypothetical protein Bbelb_271540 [Branchiostoma belcheri]|nr:hypothetical protein Bbelb_271540 [Branchiostoma belcheri]
MGRSVQFCMYVLATVLGAGKTEVSQLCQDPHSHYSVCSPVCPPTCADPRPDCEPGCAEGCVCDDGYIRGWDGTCINKTDCGCFSNGNHYKTDEVWLTADSSWCRCLTNNSVSCDGSCTRTDPVLSDDIDNDCDGRVDEELLNGLDDDGDGEIDEDIVGSCGIDIVFVIDGSWSIGPEVFERIKGFVREIVGCLDIGEIQVGVIHYDCLPKLDIQLGSYNMKTDLQDAILTEISFDGDLTRTGNAIQYMKDTIPFRGYVPRAAVIVTDGRTQLDVEGQQYDDFAESARAARDCGIELYSIAAGRQHTVDTSELRMITNNPARVVELDQDRPCAIASMLFGAVCAASFHSLRFSACCIFSPPLVCICNTVLHNSAPGSSVLSLRFPDVNQLCRSIGGVCTSDADFCAGPFVPGLCGGNLTCCAPQARHTSRFPKTAELPNYGYVGVRSGARSAGLRRGRLLFSCASRMFLIMNVENIRLWKEGSAMVLPGGWGSHEPRAFGARWSLNRWEEPPPPTVPPPGPLKQSGKKPPPHFKILATDMVWQVLTDEPCVADEPCRAMGGVCQFDDLPCPGRHLNGLCGGPANRKCCIDCCQQPASTKATYRSLGCWTDSNNRAIPPLEGLDPRLQDPYRLRQNAIEKCYQAARDRGYDVFALQDGGWCASSSAAREAYRQYGPSHRCANNGKGGDWANHVYEIISS